MPSPATTEQPPEVGQPTAARRRLPLLLVAGAVVGTLAIPVVIYLIADASIDRRPIAAIVDRSLETAAATPATAAPSASADGGVDATTDPDALGGPDPAPAVLGIQEFLVVGSDDRDPLTEEERRDLTTGGDFGPPRTDVILVVQLRPSTDEVTIASIPRDLLVEIDGRRLKINELVAEGGPDLLVRAVEDLAGFDLEHYVEVSIPAFLTVVDAVGGVELCLDAPLADPKSGADLPAGCQRLDGRDALAYVRSRRGRRGDFERIARQQRFLTALADQVTSTRTLVDVPRLMRIASRASGSITADEGLQLTDLRDLALALRELGSDDVAVATLPAVTVDGGLAPYRPGAEALFAELAEGAPLTDRGTRDDRAAADVVVWSAGAPAEATRVEGLLYFMGYEPRAGLAPSTVRPERTIVYDVAGDGRVAGWIGATLGAEVAPFPADVTAPSRADAVVAVVADTA